MRYLWGLSNAVFGVEWWVVVTCSHIEFVCGIILIITNI